MLWCVCCSMYVCVLYHVTCMCVCVIPCMCVFVVPCMCVCYSMYVCVLFYVCVCMSRLFCERVIEMTYVCLFVLCTGLFVCWVCMLCMSEWLIN